MPIVFEAATRISSAPCDHFNVLLRVDGQERRFQLTSAETKNFISEPARLKELFVLWAEYKRRQGATFSSLIGQTVVE
ncbi:MAG: hypothetical protein C4555_06345 [Dehalococcoidia bacterium]|nr:MAG: hypothetical protein C4555_06345 [Dehalococcoidia bacterium]